MKPIYILVAVTLLLSNLYASFEKKGRGASNIGLSMSGIASQSPDFAVFINPSQINGKPAVDLFYRNYFGLKELNQIAINTEFSLFNQPIGFGITRYGNKLYSETEFTFGSSYLLDNSIILGFSVSGYNLEIQSYGSALSFGFNFSILYILNDQLRIAGAISNINEPDLGDSGEKIPITGILGISYSPIQQVEILMDSFKEDYFDFAYRFGARINVISNINILTGFQDDINSFSAGLELIQNSYAIKYSVDIHPVLSASHAIGFKYVF